MLYLGALASTFAAIYCFAAFIANPDIVLALLVLIWTAVALVALRGAGVRLPVPRPVRKRIEARARNRELQRTGRRRRLSER